MEHWQMDWPKPSNMIDCFDDWPELAELFEHNESLFEDSERSNGLATHNTDRLDHDSRQMSSISQIDDIPVDQDVYASENKIFAKEFEKLNNHCSRHENTSMKSVNTDYHERLAPQQQQSQQGQQMLDNWDRTKFKELNIAADSTYDDNAIPFNYEATSLLHDNFSYKLDSTENSQINTADHLNDQNSRSSNSSSTDQFTLESIFQPLDKHVMQRIFETEDTKNYDVLLSNQNLSVDAMSPPPINSTKRSTNEAKRPRKKARQNNIQGKIGLPMQPIKPLAPYNFCKSLFHFQVHRIFHLFSP
jgi:hypothetical protein